MLKLALAMMSLIAFQVAHADVKEFHTLGCTALNNIVGVEIRLEVTTLNTWGPNLTGCSLLSRAVAPNAVFRRDELSLIDGDQTSGIFARENKLVLVKTLPSKALTGTFYVDGKPEWQCIELQNW